MRAHDRTDAWDATDKDVAELVYIAFWIIWAVIGVIIRTF